MGSIPKVVSNDENPTGQQKMLKTVWHATLRRGKVPYFRIYDLRSTYALHPSAGGVADEWVTQLLRHGDAKVFKEVLADETGSAPEAQPEGERRADGFCHGEGELMGFCHSFATLGGGVSPI